MGRARKTIQILATLIQNANFKGFFTGSIYTGPTKAVCVPGLNCYSCPGAVGACPLGTFQVSLAQKGADFPYYVLGLVLFFGTLLGRGICGFLCPFGLMQELINKIPFVAKRRKILGEHWLRYLKYVILAVFVVILPLFIGIIPFFCKYICPSGTLSGLALAAVDTKLWPLFGNTFFWKVSLLLVLLVTSIIIFRPFCKFICPLGALYGLMNRFSLFRLNHNSAACTHCGACSAVCKMNIDPSKNTNCAECIRCGECIDSCKTEALKFQFGYSCKQPK